MLTDSIISSLNKSLSSEPCDDTISEFMARVETYIVDQRWIKKSIVLSPLVCSQYGWKCIKSDLLECVTCGVKLSVHQPSISNFTAYKTCTDKLLSDLKDHHGKHCPWPLTPSPDSFVKMTSIPKEEALNQFLKRMKACLTSKHLLPKIEEMNELIFNDYQVNELCKLAEITNEEAGYMGKSIVTLASTGWIISEGAALEKSVFKCNSCQRSVCCNVFKLLKFYDSSDKENGSQTQGVNTILENSQLKKESAESFDEPPNKRRKSLILKTGEPFNPLYEHRPWCLWIFSGKNPSSSLAETDNSKENDPGWKIFIKSLLRNLTENEASKRRSPSKEEIRNVKNLLEQWT